jgi:hypothetical protein
LVIVNEPSSFVVAVAPKVVPMNASLIGWSVSSSMTVPTIVPVWLVREPKSTVIFAPQKILIVFDSE